MLPDRTWRALLALLLPLLLAIPWYGATPAPAAPSSVMTALFPGCLTGPSTTSPGPADALFTSLAKNATTSIDVALYDFDRATVRDALLAAKGRGVTVRVVGDNDDSINPSYAPSYQSLIAGGIAVVTDTKSSLMHNKFVVFDNQVTWTGSANFTDAILFACDRATRLRIWRVAVAVGDAAGAAITAHEWVTHPYIEAV
jgi:phosphatidylserine/phosphatidylglycerophosphate/cardiolipin synthase-like enzyme